MSGITCNLSKDERTCRIAMGILLLLGAVLGLGRGFLLLIGVVMIAQGIFGWCGIPMAYEKIKELVGSQLGKNGEKKKSSTK